MPKAALRNAATSANPVATGPSSGMPAANPIMPATAKMKPTSWANLSGATGSRSVTGPAGGRRGAEKSGRTDACGVRARRRSRTPPPAGRGRTAAPALLIVDTSSVATMTTVVTQAVNLGPRTSTWVVAPLVFVDMQSRSCCVGRAGFEQADTTAQSERAKQAQPRSAATTTTATTRDAAQIDCAALGEHRLKAGGHARQLTQ